MNELMDGWMDGWMDEGMNEGTVGSQGEVRYSAGKERK